MGLGAFVERVIASVRDGPVSASRLHEDATVGSLFSGAAGVAFFLHEAAQIRGDRALLPKAAAWLELAQSWAAQPSVNWKGLPRGFFVGEAGLAYVDALLAATESDAARIVRAVARIERVSERWDDLGAGYRASEIVGGAAGAVCLVRDLDVRLPRAAALEPAREAMARIRERAVGSILGAWTAPIQEGDTLGAAHGVAGELWAAVQTLGAEHPAVKARLSEVAALRQIDEEGLVFWLVTPSDWSLDFVSSWCNGVTGHALLWSEVARQTRSAEAVELARLATESVHTLRDVAPGICCGMAGHALALQRYADVAQDSRAGRRAYDRLVLAARASERVPELELGLWQGALGVALLAMGRLAGRRAIPLLEPAG